MKIVYGDQTDIRIYDLVSGDNRPFATGYEPKWSMNGDFIYFTVLSQGMRRRRTDFGAEVEELTDGDPIRYVTDAAPGDSVIVVRESSEERGWDLRLMRLGAGGPEFEDFLTADWNEVNADVAPDGNWVAYQADEGGVSQILVRSFPVIGPPYLISPDGGIDPLWSPDGGTIYYSNGSRFMAVDVTTEPTFSASPPRLMFDEPSYVTLDPRGTDNNWHIHPDGDRFLLVKSPRAGGVDGEEAARMFIVTNWFTELRERMGNN